MNQVTTSALLAITLLVTSCTTSERAPANPGLVRGASKQTVTATLGKPLRIEKHPDGSESWYYHTNTYRPRTTSSNNYEQPGETISERDLRLDFEGHTSSATIDKITVPVEHPIAFSPHGYLTATPRKKLSPNHPQ